MSGLREEPPCGIGEAARVSGADVRPGFLIRRRIMDLLLTTTRIVPDRVWYPACLGVSHGTELGHVIQLARSNSGPVILGDYGVMGVIEADRKPGVMLRRCRIILNSVNERFPSCVG